MHAMNSAKKQNKKNKQKNPHTNTNTAQEVKKDKEKGSHLYQAADDLGKHVEGKPKDVKK